MKKILLIALILFFTDRAITAQNYFQPALTYNSFFSSMRKTGNEFYKNNTQTLMCNTVNLKHISIDSAVTDLFKKSRKQKTTAIIMACGGGVLFITGVITGVNKGEKEIIGLFTPYNEVQNYTAQTILLIAGGGAVLGSIPLFIAASRNLHKAKLMLSNQKTSYVKPPNVGKNITASLCKYLLENNFCFFVIGN